MPSNEAPACCAGCKRSITEAFIVPSNSGENEQGRRTKQRNESDGKNGEVLKQQQQPQDEGSSQRRTAQEASPATSAASTLTSIRNLKSVADDLICPITLELPFDPVTAEDGRVYERAAIHKHIQMSKESSSGELSFGAQSLKSPLTNLPMGDNLLPSPQTKTLIQTLIDSRVIVDEELVKAWEQKIQERKVMIDFLQKAEQGVLWAMLHVGYNYTRGDKGFPQDKELGYTWIRKAHEAGSIQATSRLGKLLLDGNGVEKNVTQGILYISMAAVQGSNYAAYRLGESFMHGEDGLSVNIPEAIKWLKKCLDPTCTVRDLHDINRESARLMLVELERRLVANDETSDDSDDSE